LEDEAVEIPVLIEPNDSNGYRVTCGEPLALTAEGRTKAEAMQKMRELLQKRLHAGAELGALEIGPKPNPWMKYAGWLKDDPLFDEWQKEMEEYRREVDAQEGI
jgi:predicted RNase H-like HicB family nuclease